MLYYTSVDPKYERNGSNGEISSATKKQKVHPARIHGSMCVNVGGTIRRIAVSIVGGRPCLTRASVSARTDPPGHGRSHWAEARMLVKYTDGNLPGHGRGHWET